jgi:predicted Ser/Thr protein kinase
LDRETTKRAEHGRSSAEGDGDPQRSQPPPEPAPPPAATGRDGQPRWCEGTRLLDGRFTVKRLLGQGAMGVVYDVEDRERRARVALKTLSFVDAAGIYRLKQEFRALAGVSHPNLVGLHELFCDNGEWFFTMDLVRGLPLSDYLGEGPDHARLKRVFGELAAGIRAVHAAGKLHRDLKPTNAMVTREHRVVIMDFGLASDQESGGAGRTVTEDGITGTPFYMAPEQAASQGASCASDWYAFGVMLFQALTGEGPFQGSGLAVLLRKQLEDAPRASALRDGIPTDLEELCAALLDRRPEARPSYEAIVKVLGEASPAAEVPKISESLFVGREEELGVMERAFETAEGGRPIVLFVHGPSGIGKSALVERFLERLEERRCAVLLSGRCYEQESLPYKACDSLIDALSRYLRMLPRERASGLLPRQVHALARLFPAIGRLPVVHGRKQRHPLPADPTALQQEGFVALKELMSNIAAEELPVLFVDDLQWSDVDGANLLSFVLSPPDPPPLLFIGAYRSGETGEGLRTLSADLAALRGAEVQEIALGSLSPEASERLARDMLPENRSGQSRAIAAEAEGSPFFITELARYAGMVDAPEEKVTLERVIRNRVAHLATEDRRLVEAVSVATGPAAPDHLGAAAGTNDVISGIGRLESAALVRYAGGPDRRVTFYHDRIRETVLATIDEESQRQWHARWAEVVATSAAPDTDALARYFAGAGNSTEALVHTERAGDRAIAALAFDYAASLYDRALALLTEDDPRSGALWAKLGRALADAGRARESARALVKAALRRPASERIDLRLRAAEQALMGGDFELGMSLLGETLPCYGLKLPKSKLGAIVGILGTKLRLGLTRRKPIDLDLPAPAGQARRIDICTTLGYLLYFFNPPLGLYYVSLSALYRLRSSKRSHRLVGLAMLAIDRANFHPAESRRIEGMLNEATELARLHADAPDLAQTLIHAGLACTNVVKPRKAADLSSEALFLIRRHCTGAFAVWGSQMVQRTLAAMLIHAGDFFRQRKVLDEARTDNLRHRSLFQERYLDVMEITTKLAEDDADGSERIAAECWQRRSSDKLSFFDVYTVGARCLLAMYQNRPETAHALIEQNMSAIRKTGLMQSKARAFEVLFWRGTAALAVGLKGASDPAAGKALRIARAAIRQLNGLDLAPARAVANTLLAALALRTGDRGKAEHLMRESIAVFGEHQMANSAAGVRRCLGLVMGGSEGRALLDQADADLRALGIRNPARLTATWLPGFDDAQDGSSH